MSVEENQQVCLSDVLENAEVKKWVDEIIQEEKLQNPKITVSAGSNKGDNYFGNISKILIQDEHEKNIHLILKGATSAEGFRNIIPLEKLYKREIFMYTKVLPEFKKFQKDKGCDGLFNKYPTYLQSCDKNLNEYILMKDVKNEGFAMTNRKDTLDYDHVKLVLENLAKYHAISYAMRKHQPELFKCLSDLKDLSQYFTKQEDAMENFKSLIIKATNTLDPVNETDVLKKFVDYMTNKIEENLTMLSDPNTYDEFATICHGDCWTNNILFKYENLENPEKPTDLCFLDWQVSRYGSPVLDISYFMYICTSTTLREKHFDELMDIYYLSLSDALIRLDCKPEIEFPRKVFDEHLVKFFKHGLHMACMLTQLFTSESEEIPDFNEITEGTEEIGKMMVYTSKNESLYKERMGGVIRHAVKKGYI